MTTRTTLGRQLVRAALPQKFKDRADAPFTADYIQKLTTEIAKDNPQQYIDVLQRLNHIGQRVVSAYGRQAGLTIQDVGAGADVRNKVKQFNAIIDGILNDPKLTNAQKQQKVIELGYKYTDRIKDAVVADHRARGTALYNQMQSKARGNPMQLTQLNFGDLGVRDALNRDIPYFAASPRASGASPFACWVGASSSRKGFYDVQAMTGRAGYLGKQASNATHNVPIIEQDCGTQDTGLAVKADSDALGAVLLRSAGNYPAGSIITEQMLQDLDDDAQLIVRSPMACKSKHGVCARCSGLDQNGKFPSIGEYVALNASKTFIEKATQAGVGCLHPGTPVRMADGSVKPIGQLRIGDTVLGADKYGHMQPVKVTYIFDSGIKPVYRFTYRYGSTRSFIHLLATAQHKVLQSTQASNCAEQQHNGIPRILPAGYKRARISALHATAVARSGGKHIPYALLLGLLLGDGCYTAGVRYVPHLSCADPKLILDTQQYMRSLGLKFVFHKGSQCYYRISKLDSAYTGRNYARSILAEHDMLGKYAHEKVIPTDAIQWDNESISALISGLIITDGCLLRCGKAKSPSVSFASTSIKLVTGLRHHLFMRCAAAMPRIKRNKYGNRKRVLYSVTYAQPTEALKVLRFIKLYGVKQNLRLEYIQQLQSQPQAYSGVRSRRVSCEFVGNMPTVDIQVDNKDHLFVLANGMIVSNSKHVGGTGGKLNLNPQGQDQPTGMDALQRLFYVPSTFKGAAVLAPVDGTVQDIRKAPQGGHYITVGTTVTYAPQARTVKVNIGDEITAGDKLTNGIPNPATVVQYKGLGQGRRYFLQQLNRTLKQNKWGVNKRNLQQFSRSFLDNVQITDPDGVGQYLPGDIVNYSSLQKDWEPRQGAQQVQTAKARNMYLEMPALHYTIGTRITPAVQKDLAAHGFDKITVHAKQPPFKAKFIRSQSLMLNDQNWLPRMMGQRLQQTLFDAAQKGVMDRYDSPSYIDKVVASPYKPQG